MGRHVVLRRQDKAAKRVRAEHLLRCRLLIEFRLERSRQEPNSREPASCASSGRDNTMAGRARTARALRMVTEISIDLLKRWPRGSYHSEETYLLEPIFGFHVAQRV